MAKGLTEKQRTILEFIIDFQQDNGFPPTIRELGDAFSIGSLRGVTVHLDALVRKGYMTRDRSSRSIRVVGADPRVTAAPEPAEGMMRLPLIRSVRARGESLTEKIGSDGQVERYLPIPEELAASATENGFVMRVGAAGVYGEPIVPGDLLIVRPQHSVMSGELVVTLSHGDMVVTRADPSLANPDAAALSGNEILGRVVGLMRRY